MVIYQSWGNRMDVLAGAWKGASNLELEEDYLKIPTIESDLEIPPSGFSQCLLLLLRNL